MHVADGRTLDLESSSVDFAFSYITLQHCSADDAKSLANEAVRVTKSGGMVALNFRTWTSLDAALVPLGGAVRVAWRTPKAAKYMARVRVLARLVGRPTGCAPTMYSPRSGSISSVHGCARSPSCIRRVAA